MRPRTSASAIRPPLSADTQAVTQAGDPHTLADVTDFLQVSTAVENRDAAVALAESAVAAKLAGNAQVIGPVISVFWHLGENGTGEEYRVLLNTTAERYKALEEHLLANHPWQNPEIVATAIVAGSAQCLEWLRQSTAEPA